MILLDTHIALWAITDDERLPESAKSLLQSGQTIYFSVASMWEVELKHKKNPENMPFTGRQFYLACINAGMHSLPIKPRHIFELNVILNNDTYHNDPFDHLLLSTAIGERLLLLTHDEKMRHYKNANIILC